MIWMRIVKIDGSNKGILQAYLRRDVVRHAFALFDLTFAFGSTDFYVAADKNQVTGYLLIYRNTALKYPSVIIDAETDAAEKLLGLLPREKAVLFCSGELLARVREKVKDTGVYRESLMAITKGEERLIRDNPAKRLTIEDAKKLAGLYSELGTANRQVDLDSVRNQLALNPFYGIYDGGELVSVAGVYVTMPEVCIIGGVFTRAAHRGKGFAKLATSAVLEHALRTSSLATLYVRSDNAPAISVYEKLGFHMAGGGFRVDLGTGLMP